MAKVTLNQLRYFEALAAHRHFGHAAEVAGVSQPALSVQIRALEAALGSPLVERAHRNIRLTAVGEIVARRSREILQSVDELADLARAATERWQGRLRLGVIPTIAPYILPDILRNLARDAPDVDVDVRETLTPRLLQELSDGLLDTAIVALPVSEPNFHEEPLFTEDFLLVRSSADAEKPIPDAETLREMRLLLLEEGHCFRDQAMSFCNLRPTSPREGLDATSLSTLVQMVASGIGVTLIPEMAAGVETRSAPISLSRFDPPGPSRTVGMIWRKSSPLGDHLSAIAKVISGVRGGAEEPDQPATGFGERVGSGGGT